MINERIFGAPIPKQVQEKLDERQRFALGSFASPSPNKPIEPVFPDSNGNPQADIHSRTPFVRMWTGLRLIDPAVMFDETNPNAGFDFLELTPVVASKLGIQTNAGATTVDLEEANKILEKIKENKKNEKGQYFVQFSGGGQVDMGDPKIVQQLYPQSGEPPKYYLVYNDDRDQLNYARQVHVIGDYRYQENYGEVDTNESLTSVIQPQIYEIGRKSNKAVNVNPLTGASPNQSMMGGGNRIASPAVNIGSNTGAGATTATPLQQFTNEVFPQQLKDNPLMKPQAGITSVTSETEGSLGVIKKTTISFVVHNFYDYDRIYNKFFLKPGATIFVDFGWSSISDLYNPEDLLGKLVEQDPNSGATTSIPLIDVQEKLYDENNGIVTKHQGDLEVLQGIVTDYSSKILMNGSVECSVTLTSANSALVNFKTDKITNARIHSILKDGILLAGLIPILDDEGAVPGGDDDNDLKELLSFPNSNSSPKSVIEYQKNLRLLAQQQLSTAGQAPTGNSIRTGIFVDNLNADNVYMSWGLFEDLIMNSEFGHGKDVTKINNGKDFQVRMDSSTTFTTYSKELLEKQRVLLSVTEEPPKILYPEWWNLADDDLDSIDENGGSYNWQKKKFPVSEFNETYDADLLNKDKGAILKNSEFIYMETKQHKRIPLREVFINVEVIMEAFRQNNTVMKVINSILKTLNEDSDGVFQWKMVTGNTDSQFKIVDLHYLSILKKITNKIPNNQPLQGFNVISPEDNPLFTFKIMSPQSIVVDYNLEFNLPQGNIGAMYAIQGMSHDTSVVSIDDELDDVMGLTSLDTDSNIIIYEPDNGKYRIEKLQNQKADANNFNVYDTISDIISSDTWNISGVTQQGVLSQALTGSNPIVPPNTAGGAGGSQSGTAPTPTVEDLIKANDDRLKALGFIVCPTFTDYYRQKIRGTVVESERPNLLPYTLSLKLYGIASIVPGDTFKVDYLPEKHFNHTFLQTTKVKQNIDSTGWYTTLETQYRLLPNAKQTSIKGRNKNRMRLSANALKRLPICRDTNDLAFINDLLPYMNDIKLESSDTTFDFIIDFTTGDMKDWESGIDEGPNILGTAPQYQGSKYNSVGLITKDFYDEALSTFKESLDKPNGVVNLIQKETGLKIFDNTGGSYITLTIRSGAAVKKHFAERSLEDLYKSDMIISAAEYGARNSSFKNHVRFGVHPPAVRIKQDFHPFRLVYLNHGFMLFDKEHPNYTKIWKLFNTSNVQSYNRDGQIQKYYGGAAAQAATTIGGGFFQPRPD